MQIHYVPEDFDDLVRARDWYDECAEGLGDDFIRMVYAEFECVQVFPQRWELVYASFRRALIRRFPYVVYYIADQGQITVYGVFHSARDPNAIIESLGKR